MRKPKKVRVDTNAIASMVAFGIAIACFIVVVIPSNGCSHNKENELKQCMVVAKIVENDCLKNCASSNSICRNKCFDSYYIACQ